MNFETVIGLEVHVELKPTQKSFHRRQHILRAEPNSNTNVIDWGYPGVLPVMNKAALEFGMKAALALNCEISKDTHFDRKNYFHPDNPESLSNFLNLTNQSVMMVWIEIEVAGKKKNA